MDVCIQIASERIGRIALEAEREGGIAESADRVGVMALLASRVGAIAAKAEKSGRMMMASSFVCEISDIHPFIIITRTDIFPIYGMVAVGFNKED